MVKYDSYKDSGIEWIGKIPKHWILNKVGNNTYVKGRIGWKGLRSEDFIDEGPYLITGTDFNTDGSINWDRMYHVCQERYDEDPFIQLKDHDVLITKDGTIGKVVYVGELQGLTCLNSGIFLTRPLIDEYIPKYFYWVLNSNVFKVFVDYNSGGSTIQHLYQNVFVSFKIPLPSLPEQHQIVQYLDNKTTLIDKLIQKTQEKINLLREKRTSLINHTVTKGLNPHVETKDSGVEWIGEIPKHWIKTKIIRFCEVKDGTHDTPEYIDSTEHSVPLVTSNSFVNGGIDFSKSKRISYKDYVEINKRSNVQWNDIIMSMIGSNIGNRVLVTEKEPFSIKNVCLFKTSQSDKLIPKYLLYLIDSKYLKYQIDFSQKGGGQPFLSLDELRNLIFPFPPKKEQHQIVEFLDEQTQLIDTLIQKEEKRVELLKEYRQTLISDLVTGKIKVTDHE